MTGAVRPGGVGHEITRRFPAANVARRDGPGRARQVAFAGEKFKVNRRPKKRVAIHPLIHLRELFHSRAPSEEKILGLKIQPFDHVLLGGVVFVAGRDRVTVHAEVGKKIDFLLQEMNRETNTILSKTGGIGEIGLRITDLALAAKADIEKIREQALNLE